MTNYILFLEQQISELNTLKNGNDFSIWKHSTTNILSRIFDKDSSQIKQLEQIKYWQSTPPPRLARPRSKFDSYETSYEPSHYEPRNNLDSCIDQSRKLLSAFVKELTIFGVPVAKEVSHSNGINIHVNQNQHVNLSVVLHSLRDELTGRQLKEVEEIVKSDESPEERKKNLVDKIKSFGGDVASNILANLLTNPQVYQAFM